MNRFTAAYILFAFATLQVLNVSNGAEISAAVAATENGKEEPNPLLKRAAAIPAVAAEIAATTTESPGTGPSLPQRIRESIYNGIRNFGNAVRFVPATLTDLFRNVSRTTSDALRRNTTVILIMENSTSTSPPVTSTTAE